jgi:hypothetical protein
MKAYAYREKTLFFSGIFFLFLGSIGDFVVPLYIGLVITALSNNDYTLVNTYCLQLFLIICVSQPISFEFFLVLGNVQRTQGIPVYYNV